MSKDQIPLPSQIKRRMDQALLSDPPPRDEGDVIHDGWSAWIIEDAKAKWCEGLGR